MTLLDDVRAAGPGTSGRLHDKASRRRNDEAGVAERAATSSRSTRSRAAQRAIDKHAKRHAGQGSRSRRSTPTATPVVMPRPTTKLSLTAQLTRVPFVVPVLVLLGLGLGLSLWLSAMAAQNSYQISVARNENQTLADKYDALKKTYESGNSAAELADKAAKLGMVPAQNPARMIVGANGKPRISGDPTPATGKPMGTINPDNAPDPTSKIDPKKVDDSVGLSGESAAASSTAQSSAPSASATATPDADPSATSAAPNVLPQASTQANPTTSGTPTASNGNPPSSNSSESR